MNKIIELQRNSFKLGLGFTKSKGATYIRGFAINFRHRSIRFKVGVRPIIEVRPILRNLRYMNIGRETFVTFHTKYFHCDYCMNSSIPGTTFCIKKVTRRTLHIIVGRFQQVAQEYPGVRLRRGDTLFTNNDYVLHRW